MKFQSNFEGYRNDLAKDLKEKRSDSREDAQVFLAAKKETDEYKLAKGLKKEINNPDLESFNREHESIYFEKIDIADQIPEELKIYLDKIKLIALDKTQAEWIGKKSELFDENLQKITFEFLNNITEGDFISSKMLNHVVYGYGSTYEGDDESWNFSDIKSDINKGRSRNHRINGTYFSVGESQYCRPERAMFIVDPQRSGFKEKMRNIVASQFLNYPPGNSHYYDNEPSKIYTTDNVAPISPFEAIDGKKAVRLMTKEEKLRLLEIAMRWDYTKSFDGIEITFEDAKWEDIVKWMIDLPNHTLYKLKDEYLEK